MASDSTAGVVVLGLAGTAVGAFIVDYVFSEPGESWFDKIVGRGKPEEGAEGEPPPSEEREGAEPPPERRALPPGTPPMAGADAVREAQARLNALNLQLLSDKLKTLGKPGLPPDLHLPLAVDGILGQDTARAMAFVQDILGLPATGMIDQRTLELLRRQTPEVQVPSRVERRPAPQMRRAAPLPKARPEVQRIYHPAQPPALRREPVTYQPAPSPEELAKRPPPPAVTSQMAREAASRLNAILAGQGIRITIRADGAITDALIKAIKNYQKQVGLPQTGMPDARTLQSLRGQVSHPMQHGAPAQYGPPPYGPQSYVGVDAPAAGDWKAETASLGSPAQDIIQHAIDSESNSRVLVQLAAALEKASFPLAAAAVKAKAPQGATKTGYFVGAFDPGSLYGHSEDDVKALEQDGKGPYGRILSHDCSKRHDMISPCLKSKYVFEDGTIIYAINDAGRKSGLKLTAKEAAEMRASVPPGKPQPFSAPAAPPAPATTSGHFAAGWPMWPQFSWRPYRFMDFTESLEPVPFDFTEVPGPVDYMGWW